MEPLRCSAMSDALPNDAIEARAADWLARQQFESWNEADAKKLEAWLAEKDRLGRVAALPAAARDGLSRTIQFEALEKFLLARSAEAGRRGRAL